MGSQSWGERGGCWGDLVQVIRIINILPHPCLRGSCSEGVLKMAPNVQTSKCWLQCTGSGTCDKETERDTQGDVANQLRSILLSARAILITYYRYIYHARYIEGTTRGSLTKIGSF